MEFNSFIHLLTHSAITELQGCIGSPRYLVFVASCFRKSHTQNCMTVLE